MFMNSGTIIVHNCSEVLLSDHSDGLRGKGKNFLSHIFASLPVPKDYTAATAIKPTLQEKLVTLWKCESRLQQLKVHSKKACRQQT